MRGTLGWERLSIALGFSINRSASQMASRDPSALSSLIFCWRLLLPLTRGFAPWVILVLDSFLYCMLLPSEGDKPTKVTCKDPWWPEVKMKGIKRDKDFLLRLQVLFQLHMLRNLHSDTSSKCKRGAASHAVSPSLVREELRTKNVVVVSLGLVIAGYTCKSLCSSLVSLGNGHRRTSGCVDH